MSKNECKPLWDVNIILAWSRPRPNRWLNVRCVRHTNTEPLRRFLVDIWSVGFYRISRRRPGNKAVMSVALLPWWKNAAVAFNTATVSTYEDQIKAGFSKSCEGGHGTDDLLKWRIYGPSINGGTPKHDAEQNGGFSCQSDAILGGLWPIRSPDLLVSVWSSAYARPYEPGMSQNSMALVWKFITFVPVHITLLTHKAAAPEEVTASRQAYLANQKKSCGTYQTQGLQTPFTRFIHVYLLTLKRPI